MPRKLPPPVRVEPNPFGEFSPEQLAGSPNAKDKFYLAGYSEKRRDREVAIKAGEKPEALARRFQYISDQKASGAPDKSKYVEWIGKGYRPVRYDELEGLGIDPERSTCERGPIGEARVASQILMVCDAPTAAFHYKQNQALIDSQFKTNVEDRMNQAVDDYNAKHGRTTKTGTKAEVVTETKRHFEME